jgi:hypothetical protein
MRSPFPGMDPYLERYWSDMHTRLILLTSNQLQTQLPQGLRARVEETVRLEELPSQPQASTQFIPDVMVASTRVREVASSLTLAEPVVIAEEQLPVERHLEIVATRNGHSVVTVVEILSPANKMSMLGRLRFLDKRRAYLCSGVNYVEIDLLRGSRPLPPPSVSEEGRYQPQTYLIRVFRSVRVQWEIYPVSLRQRLPAFRIPLRPTDADVVLDLQAAIETAYIEGAYEKEIDYTQPVEPPLEPDEIPSE